MDEDTKDKIILARAKSWTPDLTILLRDWKKQIDSRQTGHASEARSYSRRHYLFGVPAIIGGVVVSVGDLSTFQECDCNEGPNCEAIQWIRLAIGILSIFPTVLTALATFMNYQSRSEEHKQFSGEYESLSRRIETLLLLPDYMRGDPPTVILSIRDKYDSLVSSSPSLPGKYSPQLKYRYKNKIQAPSPNQILLENPKDSQILKKVLKKKRSNSSEKPTIGIDLDSAPTCMGDESALAAARLAYLKEQEIQKSKTLALQFELQRLESHAKNEESKNKKSIPTSPGEESWNSEEELPVGSKRDNDEKV